MWGDGNLVRLRRGRQIAIDVARGLAYLHKHNIASLDVKSPNVLLTPTRSAKIAVRAHRLPQLTPMGLQRDSLLETL